MPTIDVPQPQPGPSPTPSPVPVSGQKPSDYVNDWYLQLMEDSKEDKYFVSDVQDTVKTLAENLANAGM
jgi:hypothetical protein